MNHTIEKRKNLRVVVALLLVVNILTVAQSASANGFSCGSAITNGPTYDAGTSQYQISTVAHLEAVRDNSSSWNCSFLLLNDIVSSPSTSWNSVIGTPTPFTGIFDGGGFKISGINIVTSTNDTGLFGVVENPGVIKNLGFTGSVESPTGTNVGGLVGKSTGRIENSYATGNVRGYRTVGGLAGYNDGGTIQNSYATGSVIGQMFIGGLLGTSYGYGGTGLITGSFARGSVTGDQDVGGLVGFNYGPITNSYSMGNVDAVTDIGGLVGYNDGGAISKTYSTGNISGTSAVGSLVGTNDSGIVSDSFSSGEAIDSSNVRFDPQPFIGSGSGTVGIVTTSEMKAISTFGAATWDIVAGWTATGIVWGICTRENNGFPFLNWQFTSQDNACVEPATDNASNSTNGQTPTAAPTSPNVEVAPFKGNVRIAQFAGNSPRLTASLKRQVRAALAKFPQATQVSCRGYVKTDALNTRRKVKLSRDRARAVCNYFQQLKPTLRTSIDNGKATSGQRRVLVTLSN